MDEFIIGLSGTLEVNETVNAIKAKLPDVAKKINSGNDNSLLFVGKLDESATITQLQNQLNEISKKLTFEIKSDGLQNVISSLKEVSKVLAQTANSTKTNNLDGQIKSVEEYTDKLGKLTQIKKQYDSLYSNKPASTTSTYQDGFTTTSVTQYADSQKNDTKVITENLEAQQKAINNAERAADKYRQTLATLSDSVARSTSKDYLADETHRIDVVERIASAKAEIDRLAQTTDKDAFARQKLSIEETISSIRTYISEMQKVEVQTRNAESAAKDYTARLEEAQQKAIGKSADKRITDPQQLAELSAQYMKVSQAIEAVKNATAENFQAAKTDARTALQSYKAMITEFKALNELQTVWRTTPIEIIKEKQFANLKAVDSQLKMLGVSGSASLVKIDSQVQTVDHAISAFRQRLQSIGDTDRQGMTKWLNDFAVFKSQIEAINGERKLEQFAENAIYNFDLLGTSIKKVGEEINSSQFANSEGLASFQQRIEEIRKYYENLEALKVQMQGTTDAGAKSEMAIRIAQETDDINRRLKQTEAEFKNFETTARSALNTDNLDLEKQTLSNNITNWLKQNTAAAESTQKAMRDLRAQIEGADKATLNNLKKQFSALKAEAQATGNVGKSFFDQLKSNIAKFTGWYSIGNAIARIRRQIVSAVNDLKDMDTTLTEISKTTGKTVESLESLGQAAYEAASNYGRTVQDYLSGVLEMSRAGYTNAEQMAELSLKAQSAGAMTAELANQYLIATDAAYKLNGSEEELTKILDGQNKINKIVLLCGNI